MGEVSGLACDPEVCRPRVMVRMSGRLPLPPARRDSGRRSDRVGGEELMPPCLVECALSFSSLYWVVWSVSHFLIAVPVDRLCARRAEVGVGGDLRPSCRSRDFATRVSWRLFLMVAGGTIPSHCRWRNPRGLGPSWPRGVCCRRDGHRRRVLALEETEVWWFGRGERDRPSWPFEVERAHGPACTVPAAGVFQPQRRL